MSETPKRKRRWLQFSLRSLLIFTVLCALAAAWLGRKIERKRQEQAIIDQIHAQVVGYNYDSRDGPDGPNWLRALLGENFFNEVCLISFREIATDESLRNLGELKHLQVLDLSKTKVSDAGLECLRGVTELRDLNLCGTNVSDAGLRSLNGSTQLHRLDLSGSKLTDAGLSSLNRCSQLVELDLSFTEVSAAGLKSLELLTQLKHLLLYRTRVTDAGVVKLQTALPNCEIVH